MEILGFNIPFAFLRRVKEGNNSKTLHLVGERNGEVIMNSDSVSAIEKLDKQDQDKIEYFAKLLLNQSKYKKLKDEIEQRREEIKNDEILSHDDVWKGIDA